MGIKIKKFFLHHKAVAVSVTALLCLIGIVVLLCLSTYIPRSAPTDYDAEQLKQNPFASVKTDLAADLSFSDTAPTFTMSAIKLFFENNNSYSIDAMRIPLRLTADGRLVIFGSGTLDAYTDCDEVFKEKNLNPEEKSAGELKQYNMGYHFLSQGKYPYRGKTDLSYVRIVTLEEFLDYMRAQENIWKKNFRYFFEIKSEGDYLTEAVNTLKSVMETYNIADRSATFPYVADGCATISADGDKAAFYLSCVFGASLANKDYSVLILPLSFCGINFAKKSIVDYAHSYGIAVYFENVKSVKDAERASAAGADGVFAVSPSSVFHSLIK